MSLLNQVLQDLDERTPAAQARPVHLSVAPTTAQVDEDSAGRRADWLRLLFGVLVVLVFVVAVWKFYPVGDDGAAKSAVPPPTPAPATMPAPADGVEGRVSPAPADAAGPTAPGAVVQRAGSRQPVAVPDAGPTAAAVVTDEKAKTVGDIAASVAAVPQAEVGAPVAEAVVAAAEQTDEVDYLVLRNTELPVDDAVEPVQTTAPGNTEVKTAKAEAGDPVERARQAIGDGELSAAEVLLQERLLRVADDRDARELLIGLMLRGGRYDAAMQELDAGLVHHPRHGKFLLIKARILAQLGQTGPAIGVLESAAAVDSGKVERLQMLGALYQQESRFAEAVDSYRELLKIDQRIGSSWVGLAISLDGQGDPKALQAYKRALSLGGLPQAAESYARQRVARLETYLD